MIFSRRQFVCSVLGAAGIPFIKQADEPVLVGNNGLFFVTNEGEFPAPEIIHVLDNSRRERFICTFDKFHITNPFEYIMMECRLDGVNYWLGSFSKRIRNNHNIAYPLVSGHYPVVPSIISNRNEIYVKLDVDNSMFVKIFMASKQSVRFLGIHNDYIGKVFFHDT